MFGLEMIIKMSICGPLSEPPILPGSSTAPLARCLLGSVGPDSFPMRVLLLPLVGVTMETGCQTC